MISAHHSSNCVMQNPAHHLMPSLFSLALHILPQWRWHADGFFDCFVSHWDAVFAINITGATGGNIYFELFCHVRRLCLQWRYGY
jgi:hypothetical protein